MQNLRLAGMDPSVNSQEYLLATLHRQENVDDKIRLAKAIKGLELVAEEFKLPLIFPVHPRTWKRILQFGIKVSDNIKVIEAVDYFAFLKLLEKAKLVLTDSGGVQEEACILKVPCVTLRYNTERPETLEVGSNMLAGVEPESILEKAKIMISKSRSWKNPFGDGKAGERIVNIIINAVS